MLLHKGAPGCRPVTRGRGGGEGPAGLKKIYYICFKKLFLRPCSNVKHISSTSYTVGPLITYKRSNSAQLKRIPWQSSTVYIKIPSQRNDPAVMKSSEKFLSESHSCGISIQIGIQLEWDSDSNGVGICGPFCRLTTTSGRNQQNILPWQRFCRSLFDQ